MSKKTLKLLKPLLLRLVAIMSRVSEITKRWWSQLCKDGAFSSIRTHNTRQKMRTGSQWKLFWKSRSPVEKAEALKTTRCRLLAFIRSHLFCVCVRAPSFSLIGILILIIPVDKYLWTRTRPRLEAAVPEPATLSQSLAAGRSRAAHREMRPEFPLCGERELGVFFLLLASAAGVMLPPWGGKRDQKGEGNGQSRCGREIQTRNAGERSHFSGNGRVDQSFHHAIIICCHRLPSNPKLLFAGGSFLTTRADGGCCCCCRCCCWPPAVTAINCEQHCAETWPTSPG